MENSENTNIEIGQDNPEKIETRGGARPGAGRPKGEASTSRMRRVFGNYIADEELKELIERAIAEAKEDNKVLMYVLDQCLGKAAQRVEMTGEDGNALMVQLINYAKDNPNTTQLQSEGLSD